MGRNELSLIDLAADEFRKEVGDLDALMIIT
jgi:hypothetical protein